MAPQPALEGRIEMGSDIRYSLINSFKAIDDWRANILFNMMGTTIPGFKNRDVNLELNSGDRLIFSGQAANASQGVRMAATDSNPELVVAGKTFATNQDNLDFGAGNPSTHLGIIGNGYFAVAEGFGPGSRVFFTRDGSFSWKQVGNINGVPQYKLVNEQGLYVLRAQDISVDPKTGRVSVKQYKASDPNYPPGMVLSKAAPGARDGAFADASQTTPGRITGLLGETQFQGNMSQTSLQQLSAYYGTPTDHDSDLAIVQIPSASDMVASSYGGQIYELPAFSRSGIAVDSLRGWFQREGANGPQVVPNSLEMPDSRALLQIDNQESYAANYVFQNLSTFMQDYNKSVDDLLSLIQG